MNKEFKLKKITRQISEDEYISNINDIMGEVKNITLKATIIAIKKLELKEGIIVGLKLKDKNGIMPALLLGSRDTEFKNLLKELSLNEVYLIKGNTLILKEPNEKELDIIKNYLTDIINVGDIFLAIRSIKKVN